MRQVDEKPQISLQYQQNACKDKQEHEGQNDVENRVVGIVVVQNKTACDSQPEQYQGQQPKLEDLFKVKHD